ncbi:glycosyltransferase family 4 protein [Photobacterium gaetbulicola]|nr:glycosyltransferase family 4 protein [Photobacterium gaetbulicola]
MKKNIVLHDYGAENHYLGLQHLCEMKNQEINYHEFSFIRQIGKGLIRRDYLTFIRGLKNMLLMFKFIFNGAKNYKVIVGIAPYDYRVIFLKFLLRNSDYYLHTSWPYWFLGRTPKKNYSSLSGVWRKFVNRSRGVFCVTNAVKNNFCEGFSYDPNKCHVVYHSYDSQYFNLGDREEIKQNSELKVLYIGRVVKSKGLDIIEKLARENDHIQFGIIGDGDYVLPDLNNIVCYGKITNKKVLTEIIREHSILLLPSRKTKNWEDVFGMVIIEALACGLFPITTDHIGPKELVSQTMGVTSSEEEFEDNFLKLYKDMYDDSFNYSREEMNNSVKKFSSKEISHLWKPFFDA